jgi:hypothetical protein
MNVLELVFRTYDVDESGVVVRRRDGKIIKHQINKKGYHYVFLRSGMVKNMRVSRMVALKYHPNPMGLPEVNHKDANKDNNHWSNLEWCTGFENREHSKENGLSLKGEKHKLAKLKDAEVLEIRRRVGAGESYVKVWGAYKDRIGWWSFRDICRGNTWKHLLVC